LYSVHCLGECKKGKDYGRCRKKKGRRLGKERTRMKKEIRGEWRKEMEKRKVKRRNQNFVKGRCLQIKK
jgi:hypothetical protein